jgi:protein TonB
MSTGHSMFKSVLSLIPGVFVAGVLFVVMSFMVEPPKGFDRPITESTAVNFVQRRKDSETEIRSRALPEPPTLPQIPTPTASANDIAAPAPVMMSMPPMTPDMSLASNAMMGDLLVGIGKGDTEVMPLMRQPAIYPQRAKARKIEGFVTARLSISADGSVTDVEVVSAEPPGIFEREAVRAMYRYRFDPKVVNGQAVGQTAMQTVEFKLK